jgi:hypothetical protein
MRTDKPNVNVEYFLSVYYDCKECEIKIEKVDDDGKFENVEDESEKINMDET